MNQYSPDSVSPPGETIFEVANEQVYLLYNLEKDLGLCHAEVINLLMGHLPIDARIARALEYLFGVPTDFWIERERLYRDSLKGA